MILSRVMLAAFVLAFGCVSMLGSAKARAADYPVRAIHVIVPFAPGGSTDIVARIVTERMSDVLGQPIVIENKAGAGGQTGAVQAARGKPDGYTLSIATVSTMAVNPTCHLDDLPYDPLTDFMPITNFADVPNVIEVNPKFPARTFKEFVKVLKNQPGRYSYGSSGTCSILHLFGEAFKQSTGVQMVHVPYRGAGPAVADAVGGKIEVMFDNLPSSMAQIKAGKLRALAVAWPERLDKLKNVPTLAEEGYPELNHPAWYGLVAPAGTPAEIITILHDAAIVALEDPGVVQALEKQGASPSGNTPQEFGAQIKAQAAWAAEVAAQGHIKLK